MPVHQRQRSLRIGDGDNTASCEAAALREAVAAHREAEAARERETAVARQVGPCKLQQPDGEEEVEAKSQGRGGGGMTTGAMRQSAGKQEVFRGGVHEANGRRGVSGQEAAERQEDKRRRRRDVRHRDNQPEVPSEPPPPPSPPPSPPPGWRRPSRDP